MPLLWKCCSLGMLHQEEGMALHTPSPHHSADAHPIPSHPGSAVEQGRYFAAPSLYNSTMCPSGCAGITGLSQGSRKGRGELRQQGESQMIIRPLRDSPGQGLIVPCRGRCFGCSPGKCCPHEGVSGVKVGISHLPHSHRSGASLCDR